MIQDIGGRGGDESDRRAERKPEATLGKAAHKDAAAGKATFPGVWGVERSRTLLAENVDAAVEIASRLPRGGGYLPELARFVGSRPS